jgi:hypothetical protein
MKITIDLENEGEAPTVAKLLEVVAAFVPRPRCVSIFGEGIDVLRPSTVIRGRCEGLFVAVDEHGNDNYGLARVAFEIINAPSTGN